MSNVAREVIWPSADGNVLVRAVFLHVGQGDSTIFLVKDGDTYRTVLVDINRDEKNGGVDVAKLMKDLLKKEKGKLGVFVNTHPHNDHLRDVVPLSDEVDIQEVWHSGHKPGKDHDDAYQDLQEVIKKVKKKHGDDAETELTASSTVQTMGDAKYHVLAPEEYVKEDIEDEKPEERYRRIHEQCVVVKFGKDHTWVIQVGDADRDAFEKHIMKKRKTKLPSQVLGGSHHGSDTFFKYEKDDTPYKKALQKIDPTYVVLSAPKRSESPHGHPDKDAVKYYEEEAGKDNVLHTGKNRECFICDVFTDGDFEVRSDTKLVNEYGFTDDDGDHEKDESKSKASKAVAPAIITGTQIDHRPMGRTS
ncbi:MAG: competence protein ComEC [Candidatus Nealsonbacteria bacterium]|nr:competence protein ComEC [Candidatus Nealsonbacteria bacterium]